MDTDSKNNREKNRQISRKEQLVTSVLGTLVVLGLLAGLGWLIHAILTQPVSTPAVNISGDNSSANQSLTDSSAAADLQAARRRAAEQVALAEVPGDKTGQAAKGVHGVSPVDISAAVHPSGSVHLPEVVNLDGLRESKSPPRVAPVDVSGIMGNKPPAGPLPVSIGSARGGNSPGIAPVDLSGIMPQKQSNVAPVNVGQGESPSGGLSPVAIAQTTSRISLPKPVVIGPMRPGDEDNLAPPELRGQMKSIKRLCADHAGNIWVGTEQALFRYSPNMSTAQRWTRMAAKELGDNGVSALAADRLGRLWVGTDHGGVLVYNGSAWAEYEIVAGATSPDSRSGPIGQHVFRIGVNPVNGDVWVSTEGGLSRYSEKSDSWSYFTRSEGLPCDNILGIAFTPNGDIYCASDCNGLIMAAAADEYKTWRTIATGPVQEPATASGSGLPSNLCNDILVAGDGTIWLATDAGLAWSRDSGSTWSYLRGKEWAAKVRGRLDGPPPGWDEQASAAAPAPLLEEDYCTCLAEDAKGLIWLGHQKSYEAIDPRDLSRKPGYLTKVNVSAILPIGGSSLIAGYGGGLFEEGYAGVKPAGSAQVAAAAPLPSAAAPPTLAELNQLLARLESVNLLAPENNAPVVALPDDWLTRGDWLGRYGRYWACLAAMTVPDFIWGGSPHSIDYCVRISPKFKNDSTRYWVSTLYANDPRVLEMPAIYLESRVKKNLTTWELNRRDSYWDDRGEVVAATHEGPNLYCTLEIPAGAFRLSLYFADSLRDFRVSVRGHASRLDKSDTLGFEDENELACLRVVSSGAGVWKRFLVRGPRSLTVEIDRNHSHNTNLAAVMLDMPEEEPPPYFCSWENWEESQAGKERRGNSTDLNFRGHGGQSPSVEDAITRLVTELAQIQPETPTCCRIPMRTCRIIILRCLQSSRSGIRVEDVRSLKVGTTCFYSLSLYSKWEEWQARRGLRPARAIENAIRRNTESDPDVASPSQLIRESALGK